MGLKINRRQAVGGLLAGSAITLSGRAWAQANPIRIGAIQTLTGALADVGKPHRSGAQVAVDQANKAGGIDGRKIELVVRDSKFSPAEAVASLRELTGNGVNLLLGEAFTHVNLATVPLLKDLNALAVGPSVIAMEFTKEQFSRNFFRSGPNAYMQFNGLTTLMAKKYPNVTRWGGIQLDNAGFKFAWDMSTALLKVNYQKHAGKQIEILDPVLAKPGASDYRVQINQLVGQNLQGLLNMTAGGDAINFLQQARPFGLLSSVKAIADNALNVTAAALKRNMPDNFWTPCMWQPEPYKEYAASRAFYTDYVALTGETLINPFAANAHTGVTGIIAAIRAAKSTETDKVIAALEGMSFDSAHGRIKFRKEDHQLEFDTGYLRLGPQEAEPGWKMVDFVRIPAADSIEPPTPGKKFEL
jgi:branched-chain amino acid transport system substrate-binding protein